MSRDLDHIVHAVHDLDAVVDLYRRLGFTVGARNRHAPSWGTQNHIVQFDGTFIELLAIAYPTHITPPATHLFSFGAFNRDFLSRGQGLSMLALEGRGAPDADEFRAAGIGDFKSFDFEREGKRADGTPVKVAFSLAFASDPKSPYTGFFTCQHRHPENFWNPSFQLHPNTAAAVTGVVLVAENPREHRAFLSAFTGERELLATPDGFVLKTARGDIQVMEPDSFREQFASEPPDTENGARLAALRFAMRDPATFQGLAYERHLATVEHMGRIIVGPEAGLGATLAFERT